MTNSLKQISGIFLRALMVCVVLGSLFYLGRQWHFDYSFEQARQSFLPQINRESEACENNSYLPACITLAKIHAQGLYAMPQDLELAKKYFQLSCVIVSPVKIRSCSDIGRDSQWKTYAASKKEKLIKQLEIEFEPYRKAHFD